MVQLQERNGLHKYATKSKSYVEKYILESVEEDMLKQQIREILFERDYTIFD